MGNRSSNVNSIPPDVARWKQEETLAARMLPTSEQVIVTHSREVDMSRTHASKGFL